MHNLLKLECPKTISLPAIHDQRMHPGASSPVLSEEELQTAQLFNFPIKWDLGQ